MQNSANKAHWTEAVHPIGSRGRGRLLNSEEYPVCRHIVVYPKPGEEFILDTNARNIGIGGVLSQVQGGQESVIAYCSKTLNRAERNYCFTRPDLLAMVSTLKYIINICTGSTANRPLCINLAHEFQEHRRPNRVRFRAWKSRTLLPSLVRANNTIIPMLFTMTL
jgi:hypothetical protein